jgi:hypothetical protein
VRHYERVHGSAQGQCTEPSVGIPAGKHKLEVAPKPRDRATQIAEVSAGEQECDKIKTSVTNNLET